MYKASANQGIKAEKQLLNTSLTQISHHNMIIHELFGVYAYRKLERLPCFVRLIMQ